MKPGRKTPVAAEPLDFKGWPRDRAKRRMRFVKEFVLTPKGVGALAPMRLRVWQQAIISGAYAPVRHSLRFTSAAVPTAGPRTPPTRAPTPSAGPAGRQRSAQLGTADEAGEGHAA